MSWFDATGIASLAKTALKEAQKTIDKALDIQEDESAAGTVETTSDTSEKMKSIKQSISNPILSTVASATAANNIWGSFTGSFFDTSAKDESGNTAVTTAPTISSGEVKSISRKGSKVMVLESSRTPNETSGRTSSASASESVEVLSSPTTPCSNLTSPSMGGPQMSSPSSNVQQSQTPSESIEIIACGIDTPMSSELFSPDTLPSPLGINVTSASCTSISEISESVEVIDKNSILSTDESKNILSSSSTEDVHIPDEEEDSISYNSVSESTAPVTIMDSSLLYKTPITVPPSRSGLHLPLSPALPQSISGHQAPSTSQLHLPVVQEWPSGLDEPSLGKRSPSYIERSLESFEAQTQLSDSTQSFEDVQQILLDEASKANRASRSASHNADRSEDVKVSKGTSEQNSGHTSADEVETATSSDIEIISGPNGNGDSSSTHSATGVGCKASPLKASLAHGVGGSHTQYVMCNKRKGHCRELSEASTYSLQSESGSDSCSQSTSEIEKLIQRVAELSEVLEARELKLVQLGRDNAELLEKNIDLKSQVDGLRCRPDTQEMNTIAEEYTQRMSALEKKFQQTLRERDALRTQLKTTQSSLSTSTSKNEMEAIIKDKDFMINELKTEGEILSKQILQHSNIIKKLRAKEKESDGIMKRQTEQIDELTLEVDRLKKSLSAKDEVERTQSEAVHKLSSEKRKLTKDLTQAKSDFEDTVQKLKTLQISFDAAKKEVTEKQQDHLSLTRKAKDLVNLQADHQNVLAQNQQMAAELESLRERLKSNSFDQSVQHQKLRQENNLLVRKLEETEQRSEEQSHAISEATIPLVRQCEALQSTLNDRTIAWEKQESIFRKKIESLEKQLNNVSMVEQNANQSTAQLNSRIQNLEESMSKALLRSEQSATSLQQKQVELDILQAEYRKAKSTAEEERRKNEETIEELTKKLEELQSKFEEQSKKIAVDRRFLQDTAMQVSMKSLSGQQMSSLEFDGNAADLGGTEEILNLARSENNSSPTLSLGQLSRADSLASNVWPMEDIDSISNAGRPSIGNSSLYGGNSFNIGGSTMIETLQASLKQRDGENHQLQWELSRLQSERNFLLAEVSSLNEQLENIKEKLSTQELTTSQFSELQEQYDAVLQMYGEKVEETQELQLDLQDVKDMYRTQIDDLLVQQRLMQQRIHSLQQEIGKK